MTAITHARRRPTRGFVAALLIVTISACGTGDPVAVPGLDRTSVAGPVPPGSAVDFTPVERSDREQPTDSTSTTRSVTTTSVSTTDVADAPATSTSPASTMPDPAAPTGPAVSTPRRASSAVVVAEIRGWPAFDVHLQTIIAAGSDAVSATVMLDGEIVHEVALGQRTLAGDPIGIGDRFRVASISKVITSITVLRLVQAGQLELDTPVGDRLADLVGAVASAGVDAITVRDLLTHRSGLGQYEDLMFRRQVESCAGAAAVGLSRPLERAPATTLRYSNLNFCLLGLLVEDVTGRPYADVVRDELLVPLSIDDMRLAGTFDVREGDVEHRSDDGRNYMEVLGAAGSWIATPTDVATIIDSLDPATDGWKPLGPQLLAEMTGITTDPPAPPDPDADPGTTTIPPPPPTDGYGMGLMIFGPGSFGHTGTLESTHAMTTRRADGYTWAITVSGDHPSSSRALTGIIDEALRYSGVLHD